MDGAAPRALLFDLGGVVIDIDWGRALDSWQPLSHDTRDALGNAFRFDTCYQRHERGEIDGAEYFGHLARTLSLSGDAARIADGWNDIFVGTIDETLATINAARTHVPCFAFSNTNAAHHAVWSRRYPAVVDAFERVFMSHELGCRKPERQAFERVVAAIGVEPGAIVFFDDVAENVAGAKAAGLDAVLVRSPADVGAALRRRNVVS